MKKTIAALCFVVGLSVFVVAQTAEGRLQGQVTDVTGAVIQGATVVVTNGNGFEQNVQTNQTGAFSMRLPVGVYTVIVQSEGFAPFQKEKVSVASSNGTPLKVTLNIESRTDVVNVEEANTVDVSPDSAAGAIVLKEDDIESLPDDEEDLAAALQALAGSGAGPNGGGIYIDGFSGGSIPPRDSIREIRINSNPFSSEFDRLGYGRIEILTKPGTDRLRGSVEMEFEDESLNSRNPFVGNRPDFQRREFEARISGPIIKNRASYFIDFEQETTDSNSFTNALVLDQNLNTIQQTFATANPVNEFEFNPRLDLKINDANTLVVRYGFERGARDNAGIGGFNLASRGFDSTETDQYVRITETAVIGSRIVNESRFQYLRSRENQTGLGNLPTVRVLDAFTGGGANIGDAFSNSDRYEFTNSTSLLLDRHTIKFGGRIRYANLVDASPNNFFGTFTFTSLDQYRDTILGNAVPAQFSISGGNPEASVSQTDLGLWIQEDWRVSNRLTLSAGLRYENQTNITSNSDFAPRFGFAWAPFADNGSPKTVIRGGYGLFFDRYSEGLTLTENRFNGINQQRFIVEDPDILDDIVFTVGGVSNIPTIDQLSAFAQEQTIRVSDNGIRSPYTSQFAISFERQLPKNTSFSATYLNARAFRLLRSRNINAPINGVRPDPNSGNVFQYESTGRLEQQQLIFNLRTRFSKYSLFTNYSLNEAKSDTDGAGTFPVNQFDLSGEFGRSRLDARHRFIVGGSYNAPLGVRVRPFVIFRSGSPYNLTTGTDDNGDTLFNERPTFGQLFARCQELGIAGGFCDPSNASALDDIVPRNFATGPDFFIVNLRTSKSFSFGTRGDGDSAGIQRSRRGRGGNPFGGRRRGGSRGGDAKYQLEFTVQVRNLFNNTNLGTPVGNLNSSLFGQSLGTRGGFGFGRGSSAGGNRRIELEVEFEF